LTADHGLYPVERDVHILRQYQPWSAEKSV